jgi:hypothetical protein
MRPTSLAVVALLVVACSGGGSESGAPPRSGVPSASPTSPPTASPSAATGGFGAIEHQMGPTDVLLRFEQGGGFVAPAFLATQAPIFTLYGDGTVIFRNPAEDPLPSAGSVSPSRPFRIARLSEDQIQKVLTDALGQGGLGAARTDYLNHQISDAPTAVFTIKADGISKSVSVYALGMDVEGSSDAPARATFAKLAARLEDFDNGGAFSTDEYAPDRYRGILLEGQAGAPDAKAWPWPEVAPADFVPDSDPNAFQLAARVMSVAEVEALRISPYQGGFQGLTLIGPGDGKVYTFSLRPLLPDEAK